MAWNGSGTFSRTNGTHTGSTTWVRDRDAGAYILAGRHDLHDQDLADGIGACLTKNNETKPTADFRPNADATYDLGSASLTWAEAHAQRLIVYGSTVPTNGVYLPAANTVGFAANSVKLATIGATATSGLEGLSLYDSGDSNGATLELVGDGATTPKKYIRVKAGVLGVLNNAYDTVITSITDAGALTAVGLTASGTGSSIPMPAFSASPITFSVGYTNNSVEVSKDAHGVVWIKGQGNKDSVASGALTYFTLNAGYRPDQAILRPVWNISDSSILCTINTDGTVVVTHLSSNNSNTYFDMSFPTT